jgi:glycerol 3-phosphatase-2
VIDDHDAVLFDLDGVIFAGSVAIPHAVDAVQRLQAQGVRCAFVTNNALRTPEEIATHLAGFDLNVDPADIVTSPQVAVRELGRLVPAASAVLVVGGAGLRDEVTAAGYRIVTGAADEPAAVIQGFAPTIGWAHLAEAGFAIQAGAVWIATNADPTLPTERGVAPGNGSLVQVVATVVGRQPDVIAGKPNPALFELAAERLGAVRPLVVGDRLDTDIAGGQRAGMRTALVLTGITRNVAQSDPQPDYVLRDLRGLFADVAQ